MAITVGSNISALRAQRRLSEVTATFGNAIERLASGMRINRASDDAAGLSISESLLTNSRLYQAANRNLNDGLSMLNIIDSALEQQGGIIQRLQELAEQSANGTFSDTQRLALQKEYSELVQEFGRIGATTSFNNLNPLNGTLLSIDLQAGIDGSRNSGLTFSSTNTASISGTVVVSDLDSDDAFNGSDLGEALGLDGSTTQLLYSKFRNSLMVQNYTSSTGQSVEIAMGIFGFNSTTAQIAYYYKNKSTGLWEFDTASSAVPVNIATGAFTSSNTIMSRSVATPYGSTGVSIDVKNLQILNPFTNPTARTSALEFSDVRYVNGARLALETTLNRATELQNARAQVGAYQSRLLTALNVNSAAKENSDTAASRIRDADIASEVATASAARIKQTIAAQILANASLQPRLALQLLSNS